MNLNLTEEEKKIKDKYMKSWLGVSTKSKKGPDVVNAPDLSSVPNESEDSFEDDDNGIDDEVNEQPKPLFDWSA